MVIRLGVVGFSEGNGHPFSFSAILNGYDEAALRAAGWGVIADYLPEPGTVGRTRIDARVTAAWGPDLTTVEALAEACYIDEQVDDPAAMVRLVDAVLIARDDWRSHMPLALPLLEAGLPVFVDKPLTLDPAELERFSPYLNNGQLASWSGHRFAPELDVLATIAPAASVLRATSVETWDRYAIHVVEPAVVLKGALPIRATPLEAQHESVAFHFADGSLLQVDVLGSGAAVGFHLEAVTRGERRTISFGDRYTAFSRALAAFVDQVTSRRPSTPPAQIDGILRAVIAGELALQEGRPVAISEVRASA